jgi:hypothetical protein
MERGGESHAMRFLLRHACTLRWIHACSMRDGTCSALPNHHLTALLPEHSRAPSEVRMLQEWRQHMPTLVKGPKALT